MTTTQSPIALYNKGIDYNVQKAAILANAPTMAKFPLSDFSFGRNRTLKFKGKLLPCTDSAFNMFLRNVLDIKPEFVQKFSAATNTETETSMLQALSSGISSKKNKMVVMMAPAGKTIISAFHKEETGIVSYGTMLDLFERVMNKHSDLEVKDLFINSESVSINVRSSREVSFGGDESYNNGLSFSNSILQGYSIDHNSLRLICSNGMVGNAKISMLKDFTTKGLSDFYNKLELSSANNWTAPDFFTNMESAKNNVASVGELLNARGIITGNSSLNKENVGNVLSTFTEANAWLKSKKVDIEELNSQQKKNFPTNVKLWDVINEVTYFGSHELGFNADFKSIQARAGALLNRKHDMTNQPQFLN